MIQVTQSTEAFDKAYRELSRLHNEMIEDSICEVLAWRMYGIDADWHWMQGELVVTVNLPELGT